MVKGMSRRDFLKVAGITIASIGLEGIYKQVNNVYAFNLFNKNKKEEKEVVPWDAERRIIEDGVKNYIAHLLAEPINVPNRTSYERWMKDLKDYEKYMRETAISRGIKHPHPITGIYWNNYYDYKRNLDIGNREHRNYKIYYFSLPEKRPHPGDKYCERVMDLFKRFLEEERIPKRFEIVYDYKIEEKPFSPEDIRRYNKLHKEFRRLLKLVKERKMSPFDSRITKVMKEMNHIEWKYEIEIPLKKEIDILKIYKDIPFIFKKYVRGVSNNIIEWVKEHPNKKWRPLTYIEYAWNELFGWGEEGEREAILVYYPGEPSQIVNEDPHIEKYQYPTKYLDLWYPAFDVIIDVNYKIYKDIGEKKIKKELILVGDTIMGYYYPNEVSGEIDINENHYAIRKKFK